MVDWITPLVSLLGGGLLGGLATHQYETKRARRERRQKLIDEWRNHLSYENCAATVTIDSGRRCKLMELPVYASLHPHLSQAFKDRMGRSIVALQADRQHQMRVDFIEEADRIEREWGLI